ncbi:hypothetical protein [Bradyrhizobium sp. SEMIA]|uniref:hypothetical protein n=1 Tax=Bradyrhizobium sp. SEMIA TaxID=2597515 RepID=UPI0018A34962|nr:hypothetical protein [Bradyrhizobium sp. SEMIA]QOG20437.1 hypothetical protein FOM02_26890 [Bradyrhizobium sp. SEMIA]
MVAYSYKGRFVAPIRVGLGLPVQDEHRELGGYQPGQIIRPKRQTIRANGKRRHARPGETLQHYNGMRTPKCFKIGDASCSAVSKISLWVHGERVLINHISNLIEYRKPSELDTFARDDGFDDWAGMRAFWLEEHDGKHLGPFIGVLIQWEPM